MKNKFVLSVILGVLITFGWATVSESALFDISSGIVRLHILANSNEEEDQRLKLKVRDRVLSDGIIDDINYIDLAKIEKICKEEIEKNGYSYDVKASLGRYYFPTKRYEKIMLPAGEYDALKIEIGKAEGENWWCVMYPPLCYSGSAEGRLTESDMQRLKESMKDDNYSLIESGEIKIKPVFKIVEVWQKLKHNLAFAFCF